MGNPARHIPRTTLPTFDQICDQLKTLIPARVIGFALRQDPKRNLY